MACTHPVYLKEQNIIVPCGKCFYCRRKYILMWSLRLTHELLTYNNKAVFVTLTYNDDNLPADKSVSVRDVQLFIKRLRKYYIDKKLKYFCVSEYGSENRTFRPHYHLIIYGISFNDTKEEVFKHSALFTKKIWKKGFTTVKPVHQNTIGYTLKYIMKNTLYENKRILKKGLKINFSLKSKGLGFDYLIQNWEKYIYANYIPYKKYKIGVPRYYRNKLIDLGYMHPEFPTWKHRTFLDNLVPDIFKKLREIYGSDYTNAYKTIESYYTGQERDPNWFNYPSNFYPGCNEIDGNHKQHFFYHYLMYIRDKSIKDELEFFTVFSPKKKIHKKGVYYGNT